MKKQNWKIAAAAAFFTVAGICYGLMRNAGGVEITAHAVAETESPEGRESAETLAEEPARTERAAIYVHICGAVKNPGVYELPGDSRVFHAVDAAGGFLEDAAQESVNLAAGLADGMKITVLDEREWQEIVPGQQGASAGANLPADSGRVNLNTATREELMTLNGVGGSRADDIIAYREQHGRFQKIEEIMKVSGIKDALFQKIKDDIAV